MRTYQAVALVASGVVLALSACSAPAAETTPELGATASTLSLPELPALPQVPQPRGGDSRALPAAPGEMVVQSAITKSDAARLVLAEVGSGIVTGTTEVKRGGYDAFRVSVALPSGGVMVGFVDKASGVVFDWQQTAPPAAAQESGDDEREGDERDGDERDGDERDGDEHEGDNDDD